MARRRRRAVAEEASHGLQSLTQQIQATPHRRLACGDVISAVSDALYEVVRASFRQKPVARVQEMRLHGWVLGELGVGASKHNVFSLAFPRGEIEVTYFSTILLVEARVGHAHDVL